MTTFRHSLIIVLATVAALLAVGMGKPKRVSVWQTNVRPISNGRVVCSYRDSRGPTWTETNKVEITYGIPANSRGWSVEY